MFDAGGLWSVMTVIGPIVLAGALIWGIVSYRQRSRASQAHTEAATKNLYRQAAKEERRG